MATAENQPIHGLSDTDIPEEFETSIDHEELLVLCIDVSGSMRARGTSGASKSDEVYNHLVSAEDGLFQRLATSSNRQGYYVAAVFFDETTESVVAGKLVNPDGLSIQAPPPHLFYRHGGATAIGSALRDAGQIADTWLNEPSTFTRMAYILLLSDGGETADSNPAYEAEQIKARATYIASKKRDSINIATVGYGDDADAALLGELASTDYTSENGKLYRTVSTGAQLRNFLLATIGA